MTRPRRVGIVEGKACVDTAGVNTVGEGSRKQRLCVNMQLQIEGNEFNRVSTSPTLQRALLSHPAMVLQHWHAISRRRTCMRTCGRAEWARRFDEQHGRHL